MRSRLSYLHFLQGALDDHSTGRQLHPEDGQSLSIHWLFEYITAGGWRVIPLGSESPMQPHVVAEMSCMTS